MRGKISAILLSVLIISGFAVKPRAAEADDLLARARAFVNAMGSDVVVIMADKTITEAHRIDRFRRLFIQAFDMRTIASFALGQYNSIMTPDQKLDYGKLTENLMIRSYYEHFKDYGGGNFQIVAVRADSHHDVFAMTDVMPFNRKLIAIEWRVRERENHLGIIDVAVEGVSMLVARRQEFSSLIMAKGGNIDAFLQDLRDHNTAVSLSAP